MKRSSALVALFPLFPLAASLLVTSCGTHQDDVIDGVVLPDVEFARFSRNIRHVKHPHLSLVPGNEWIYEAATKAGLEQTTITMPEEQREFSNATAVVVKVSVLLAGVPVRESTEWYTQDNQGAIWQFGRAICQYEGGECTNNAGSWEWAGADARPGIVLAGNEESRPEPFYQVYWQGEVEEVNELVETGLSVTVPGGAFNDCWKVHHTSKLDPGLDQMKYYCPIVGVALIEEGDVRVELMHFGGV